MYAYILITFLNGTMKFEPIGTAGPSWADCVALANFAAAARKKDDKNVAKVVPSCMAGPAPK